MNQSYPDRIPVHFGPVFGPAKKFVEFFIFQDFIVSRNLN